MNVIFLILVPLSIILESHFCLTKNEEICTSESSTTAKTSESNVKSAGNETCDSESSSTTKTSKPPVTETEEKICASESSTTTEIPKEPVTVTEKKICASESSTTTEIPAEPETNDASVLEGCTFYFNYTGHLICCSHCRPDHADDFPRVEFALTDGINKLKKKLKRCCCLMAKCRKSTTNEKPKPKEPPKSCGQKLKEVMSKVTDEINKPFYVPSVCRCVCHKYAI